MTSLAPSELLADPLARRSLAVLSEGQAASGAFVASPAFDVYDFSWLRDGAFCAYAIGLAGGRRQAAAFHRWAAAAVEGQRGRAEAVIDALEAGASPPPEAMLPARFTLDGELEESDSEPWPNFQLDGYGMWLWSLEHHNGTAPLPAELAPAAELVARYLQAAWAVKCWNCWEELDDGEHTSTLAAVAAGLDSAGRLLGRPEFVIAGHRVRSRLLSCFVHDGRFIRGRGDRRLDGSLLWLALPFELLPLDDSRIRATVEGVRAELIGPGGGVRRYLGDTYYGGGEWILLSCSLGWIDAVNGNRAGFEQARDWVRAQALPNGDLPEQVTADAQAPEMVEVWEQRWGPVATPLLWSHAMYLVMMAAGGARWNSSR